MCVFVPSVHYALVDCDTLTCPYHDMNPVFLRMINCYILVHVLEIFWYILCYLKYINSRATITCIRCVFQIWWIWLKFGYFCYTGLMFLFLKCLCMISFVYYSKRHCRTQLAKADSYLKIMQWIAQSPWHYCICYIFLSVYRAFATI